MCLMASVCVVVVGRIRWMLVVFVLFCGKICDESRITSFSPSLQNAPPIQGSQIQQQNPSLNISFLCRLHGEVRGQVRLEDSLPAAVIFSESCSRGTLACQTPIDTTVGTRLSDTFRFGKALQLKMMCSV